MHATFLCSRYRTYYLIRRASCHTTSRDRCCLLAIPVEIGGLIAITDTVLKTNNNKNWSNVSRLKQIYICLWKAKSSYKT